ncbi:hypothetical protein EU811_19460 [Arthrobacter sp. TS-15]|uniref:hypothetical protein n=1 Tax=Arthrobacter sp. TS-15 TaxID=2510797 RepID=UPI00115F0C9B|nr:hypothetical protein [Arthrobacter sp. TS-15]TQS90005.1 hypothetical protein EU811_19460 [Arthrobacter sp. TS-15]
MPTLITGLRVSIVAALGVALLAWIMSAPFSGQEIAEAAYVEQRHDVSDGSFRLELGISNNGILGTLLIAGFIASLVHLLRNRRRILN